MPLRRKRLLYRTGSWLLLACSLGARPKPQQEYLVYVVCEAADKIVLVRFGPRGAQIDHEVRTGLMPKDINGPHGIVVSPDKQNYYVTVAHGQPFGTLWKYRTKDDFVEGRTTLGMFPATTDLTPDGSFAYIVNFNLHGDMVPSSVSVVTTDQMIEVTRIPTCTMPHGSRINAQGTKQYSACMMDDMLVEIDTGNFRVSRYFILGKGQEKGVVGSPPPANPAAGHGQHHDVSCSPTWAQPAANGSAVYVACNKSSEIVEIDANTWKVSRRMPAGEGVYNLAVTRNGRLIATNKRGQSISIFDLGSGKELVRLPTKRRVVHGVVVSPDDRYAFVTVEGVGSEPGTLEIVDLESLRTVTTVDLPSQAAGVDFFKMEPTN